MDNLKFKKSPKWNLLEEDGKLILTKGADEIYLFDELDNKKSSVLYEAYKNNSFDELDTKDEDIKSAVLKLEKAGVIYKSINRETSSISFSIRFIGDRNLAIESLLKQFSDANKDINYLSEEDNVDLLIIIRNSKKLSEIMKGYDKIKVPHLLVDIAYDHTISLGPLVFPNETACLGCFVGRITKNWGDAEPPTSPPMSNSIELISALILEQVKIFQKTGSIPELIENAVSFNLKELTTKADNIYRLPWCPHCYSNQQHHDEELFDFS